MRKLIEFYIFLSLITILLTHQHCIHDQIVQQEFTKNPDYISKQQQPQYIQNDFYFSSNHKLVPFDISYNIQNKYQIPQYANYRIQSLMNVAKNFFSKLMKVKNPNPINFGQYSQQCFQTKIDKQHRQSKKSHLHLFITGQNQPEKSYLAWAAACKIDNLNNRPTFGQVNFNLNSFRQLKTNFQFQKDLETTIHQIIHVLGFSKSLYPYWLNTAQLIYKKKKPYLQTQYLKKIMEKHYGCKIGIPIEDQGSTGSQGSHLQRSIFLNQIMTASASHARSKISIFTLGILEATGWYFQIDYQYSQHLYFGENKGCQFIEYTCFNPSSYNDYCQVPYSNGCNYDSTAIGTCRHDSFSNQCTYYAPYSNAVCLQENTYFRYNTASVGGYDSRCFQSSFTIDNSYTSKRQNQRCYKSKCVNDKIIITVQGSQYHCQYPSQKLQGKNNIFGYLMCPINFQRFCAGPNQCKDHCNQRGYCLNGKCICAKNVYGEFCQSTCNPQIQYTYEFKSQFQCFQICPMETFKIQKMKICVDYCPKNTYINENQCIFCSENCKQCNSQRCDICIAGTFMDEKGNCSYLKSSSEEQGISSWIIIIFFVCILLGVIILKNNRKNPAIDDAINNQGIQLRNRLI